MRITIKAGTLVSILFFLLLTVAPSVSAQEGEKITHRVRFARGQNSATMKGKIRKNQEIIYTLRASKGQTLTARVKASTQNNDVVFTITGPGNVSLMAEGDMDTDWTGKLPESGDYQISLGMIESEFSNYTLEVSVR